MVEIERSRCPQCGSLVEHPLGQDEVKACNICGFEGEAPFKAAGAQQVMRLDLLADRPDLFDAGGLARALRGTLGIESGLPKYATKPSGITVTVDKSVDDKIQLSAVHRLRRDDAARRSTRRASSRS